MEDEVAVKLLLVTIGNKGTPRYLQFPVIRTAQFRSFDLIEVSLDAVATPKQIRELMKVDGLTNDEVKSHLQVGLDSI